MACLFQRGITHHATCLIRFPGAYPFYFLLFSLFVSFLSPGNAHGTTGSIRNLLTAQERAWLDAHPVIRIAPDPYFPPIEFFDGNGQYRGIGADYVARMEEMLGIRFEVIRCEDWDDVLMRARNREIDALPAAAQTPQRSEYVLFSEPHIVLPGVIIARKQVKGKLTLEKIRGLKITVVKAYVWQEFIKDQYPDFDLDLVPDLQTGLKKVSLGLADAMVATLPVAIYYIEKEGITNLRVAGQTGYFTRLSFASRKDWPELNTIAKMALSLIPPDDRKEILNKWIDLQRESLFSRKEFWISFLSGLGLVIVIIASILMWNRSLKRKVDLSTQQLRNELAERKLAERALQESEERYRGLVETLNDFIFIIDPEGRIKYINPEFEKITGYVASDILGHPFTEMLAPEYVAPTVENFRRGLSGAKTPIYEVELLHKDGRRIPIEVNATSLLDPHGKVIGRIGVCRDISDRKRSEAALMATYETLMTVLNSIDADIYVADMETYEILFMNRHMQDTFGGDHVGKICWKVFRAESNRCHHCTNDRLLNANGGPTAGCIWEEENPVTGRWYINYDRAIKWTDGRFVRLQVAMDSTELRRAEEDKGRLEAQLRQAQKMEAIGTLAGGISHDFNNLLQSILGYTQILLLEKKGDDPEFERLKEIEIAARKAGELIRQLLTFSRKVESQLRPVDLNQEVRQVTKILKRTLPKMIEIDLKLQDDLKIINADPAQIEQILMNLAVNARDAMPGGGKIVIETKNAILDEVYCESHLGARPGDYARLTFSDDGHGINEGNLEHIFEPFYTTKETGKGTGLGLSMVYGIVKSHGGFILCSSAPGQGTIFTICFPVTERIEEKTPEEIENAHPPTGSETVLLIDDERFLRQLGEQMLTKFGYKVLTAPDGEKGLEVYLQHRENIHLIILDLMMPGMGGERCFEELLQIDPKAKIVIASGYSISGSTKEKLEARAVGFVEKPYQFTQMLKVIRNVLDGR